MATKKITKTVSTVSVQKAVEIHNNRRDKTKVSATDLIVAKATLIKKMAQLDDMVANLDEILRSYTLAQLEAEVGANTILCIDGKINILFKEKIVTTGSFDAKGFNSSVGEAMFPSVYKKARKDWAADTGKMYTDYINGVLPPILMPYVKATRENVVAIEERKAGASAAPAASSTTSTGDEE